MRNLLFAIFTSVLFVIGLIAVLNMQQPAGTATGLLAEKIFIPPSTIQDMAYDRLEKFISENKTALIFFYDNSCDVCIAQIAEIDAMMENLSSQNPDFFQNFTYYEYDWKLSGLMDKFNATNHHTIILIKEGKEVLRTREAFTKDELLGKITSA